MKKWISLLLISAFLLVCCPYAHAEGGAFLVMDARLGRVLAQENGDIPLPMASTTKIMTALVILERVSLQEQVIIPKMAAGIEGSSLYIKVGEQYTVEELLYGLLLRSANDCAEALAWYAGGKDRENFIDLMNQKAKELGLRNTHFSNPSGLPEEDHYTTAYELALIMKAAMQRDDFKKICSAQQKIIKGQKVVNHNKLLSLYEYCIGGKTGYTKASGRCLVTMAQKDGGSLICVTLGRSGDWDIHTATYERWFDLVRDVVLAEAGACRVDLPKAEGGVVMVYNSDRVAARLFEDEVVAEKRILAPHFIYGNRKAGEAVGVVEYRIDGVLIGESALILKEDVETIVKKELFISRIFRFFRQIFLKND